LSQLCCGLPVLRFFLTVVPAASFQVLKFLRRKPFSNF